MVAVVNLEPIKVAFTSSIGNPSQSDAFKRLEEIVPLKGYKFYATYDSVTCEYCACVKIEEGQDENVYSLPIKTISGGLYATSQLKGDFKEIVCRIAPEFERLSREVKSDNSRLPIEFYKSHRHIILHLPVLSD